tara:strand:+ start:632 stop:976 length:345 start_codon:yes stop_codon:yes gene_type:complete
MPKNTLIKCIVNGKEPKFFNFEALTGNFFERLLKLPNIKSIEVADPNLEDKLTKDEFTQLAQRFEYLAPKVRKPEPLPLEEFETLIQPKPIALDGQDVATETIKQTRKKRTNAN